MESESALSRRLAAASNSRCACALKELWIARKPPIESSTPKPSTKTTSTWSRTGAWLR